MAPHRALAMPTLHLDGAVDKERREALPSPWELQASTLEHIPALASTVSERFHRNHFNTFQMAAWMDSSPGRI